jgi:hypothetical protein
MVTHPRKLIFAGIFVVALGIAAYLPGLVQNAAHHDQSSTDSYDSSSFAGSGTAAGSQTSGAVSTDMHPDPSEAQILQAVRDSLQRNDLKSAEVLLRAARALDIDNEQAIALQHDLDARMAPTASRAASATSAIAIPRAESRSILRPAHAVNRTEQIRERTRHILHRARESNHTDANVAGLQNTPAATLAPVQEVIEKHMPSERVTPAFNAVPEVMSTPAPAPAPAPVILSPTVVQQTVRAERAPMEPSQGPKSREQVRAELEHARTDGSLPRFGNPDSAGPGVATISKALPVTPTR